MPLKIILAIVIAAVTGAAATWLVVDQGDAGDPAPGPSSEQRVVADTSPSGARTSLPGLVPATGGPHLTGLETARPSPGTVVQVQGPFDDRFILSDLSLTARRVAGEVTITSDVSELLELEVLAGFYDARGNLLATGRFRHHATDHHEAGGRTMPVAAQFAIAVPARARATAVSAAVGIPVLVNE
ncbi:MAG: hypothetical protein ABIQ15_07755 [Nocardioides sp.]